MTSRIGLLCAALLCIGSAAPAAAQDFYKDKRIELFISSTVGGGNDLSARMVARYMPKHLPGTTIIPRNMPGAGGVTAANHLYNVAPRDGTAIAMVQNSALFEPLYGNDKALFDINKINWLGSPNKDVAVLMLWNNIPVNSMADAQKRGLILGVSGGLNATPAFYARVLADIFSVNIKMVAGYPGQAEAFLALERGENEGYPSAFWASLKAVKPDWIRDKKVKFILYFGNSPHPELKDVPFADDLLRDNPEGRKLMQVAVAPLAVGRPMLAPPDVPADRVATLRKALLASFKDPDYLGECDKLNLECADPTSGEELTKIIVDAYAAPKPLVDKLKALNNP